MIQNMLIHQKVRTRITKNVLDDQLIILLQLAKCPPHAVTIWYRILLDPAATSVLIEILAGIDRMIDAIYDGRRDSDAVRR